MYRCNDYISCLSVSAYKTNESIEVEAFKVSSDIDIFAKKTSSSPNVMVDIIDNRPIVSCKPLGKRIIVTCSLVCTVSNDAYLDVNPDYVWLTPDMLASAEFDIISNVDWVIN